MKRWLFTTVAALALVGLAQQAPGAHPGRLVVADAKDGSLKVLDLETAQVVGTFSTPGPANVYPVTGTPYVFAVHREANRVSVVYSGLWLEDHGDHEDLLLEKPYVFATLNTGPKPTHYFNHGHHAAIFNDGDGTVAVFDTRKLGVVADFKEYATGAPDHGAPVVMGDALLSGSLNRGVVEVYTLAGRKVLEFPGCPRLHGEAVAGNTTAFGCDDGVLLLERRGNGFAARKLAEPAGSPANARVGTLVAHQAHPFFIGNFGQGLARLDARFTPYPLPANPVRFAFSADGRYLVVLTADGRLHVLEPADGKVLRSLGVVGPVAAGGEGAVRPSLAVGTEHAYVADPQKGVVLEVELANLQVRRSFEVGGTPLSLALVWLEGVRH
ncbi:MAG: hypothetical protein C4342_01750 [Armatimonadota bacterium]